MKLIHRGTSGRLPTSTYDLVDDNGQVLGFCQVRHRPSCSQNLPLEAANHVYYQVNEPYRGRGHGKQLLGMALAEAKRIGLDKVRIAVDDDNPTSRHIVESHGAVWVAKFQRRGGVDTHLFEVSFT